MSQLTEVMRQKEDEKFIEINNFTDIKFNYKNDKQKLKHCTNQDILNQFILNQFMLRYSNFELSFKLRWCCVVRLIWIKNSSEHRMVWTANLLHTKLLPNPLGHKT